MIFWRWGQIGLITQYQSKVKMSCILPLNINTVIHYLNQIFGILSYINSDRELSFLSKELREYLTNIGSMMSHMLPYIPQRNGQCMHYNGIIQYPGIFANHSRRHYFLIYSIQSDLCFLLPPKPCLMKNSLYQHQEPRSNSLNIWSSIFDLTCHAAILTCQQNHNVFIYDLPKDENQQSLYVTWL